MNRFFIPREDKRLGDRYELLDCLGDGSYGWVWRAQRVEDDHIVALKIPKEQGARNADLEEGKGLRGKAAHPNVVSIFWMGRVPPENEWYAIEMEYFPSVTLAHLLEQGEQGFVTSYAKILAIYEQVVQGVDYLHQLGMSHGDIKPQNVLVSGDTAKVTDFGSSILPEDMYARTRENGGTILYSAPEVVGSTLRARSKSEVFAADIYSLGVLLYHLVTSRLPHDTLSQVARHTPFPRPREINSTICPALEEVILRCLSLDPAERWASVSDLRQAVEHARKCQLDYVPERSIAVASQPLCDWSSQVLRLMDADDFARAENIAKAEFEASGDPHAFRLVITAAMRDGRYFDCLRQIEAHPEMLTLRTPVRRDLREMALRCYLETRKVDQAAALIQQIISEEGETPTTLLKKASVLGLQARYEEAREILLRLNRDFPSRPAILRRLVMVFEQLRDLGKASAFLKAYLRAAPQDAWAVEKRNHFSALGIG